MPDVIVQPTNRRKAVRRAAGLLAEAGLVGVAAAVIVAVVVGWDPRLWRVYFSYGGDTFFNAINGALATPLGVTRTSERLGWPYGLDMTDFPAGEPLFTWMQWFVRLFIDDALTGLAVLWFAGFVLVGATAYLVLRLLGIPRWPAVVAALVYDFVPFHMLRAFGHTNLALFMAVPLAGLLLLWVMSGRLDRPARSAPEWRPLWRTPDWWVVAGSAFVIAVSARYYTVYFLLLLVLVSLARAAILGRLRALWAPTLIVGATLALALLTGLPQIVQVAETGRNTEVANRSRVESDLYALRLTDLLAPIPDHRVGPMKDLGNSLRRTASRGEEGNEAGLFLLGGLAFLVALSLLRRPRRWWPEDGVDDPVRLATNSATLAGLAFLFGTVGGLGGVIASLGYTQIRGWNRISIVITFFAAVGLALALSWLWSLRGSSRRWRRWLPVAVLPLVLTLAVLDQTGTHYFDQASAAKARDNDRAFFGKMADELGTGSAVFQLPWVPFPESRSAEFDYMGFRGFFNDGGRLNWSYGGMRGRESDWQRSWVTMDPETQVVGLAAAGFDAILVDRGDAARSKLEPGLRAVLGNSAGHSRDHRFVWFDLRPVHQRLVAARGAEWVEQTGARVVRPIGIQFPDDTYRFSGFEVDDWGTIDSSTPVELRRYDDNTAPVDIDVSVQVAKGNNITASSGDWRTSGLSSGAPIEFRHEASMKSDVFTFTLSTDAPNLAPGIDVRSDVRGQIVGLRVIDSELAAQIARGELRLPA